MGKAVTKVNKSEMAEFDPSMFEADAGTGINDMSQEDLALPFLKILSGPCVINGTLCQSDQYPAHPNF